MLTAAGLKRLYRAKRRRLTPQRELIFRLLEQTQMDHPTAETLYVRAAEEMPSMSLRTVYAILKDLEEMRAIRPLELGTGSMRYCASPVRHHHMVCTRCGKVKDVFVDEGPLELPPDQRRGFAVKGHDVVFWGVCGGCRMKPQIRN
jgi:Fur family transcriptional regulator, peroxide stress response regulator